MTAMPAAFAAAIPFGPAPKYGTKIKPSTPRAIRSSIPLFSASAELLAFIVTISIPRSLATVSENAL
jgi:hypothetical protein